MSTTPSEPSAPVAAPVPVPAPLPKTPSKFSGIAKKAWAGFATAATSSAAVKQEKSIAVLVVTGVLLSVGASSGLIHLVIQAVNSL